MAGNSFPVKHCIICDESPITITPIPIVSYYYNPTPTLIPVAVAISSSRKRTNLTLLVLSVLVDAYISSIAIRIMSDTRDEEKDRNKDQRSKVLQDTQDPRNNGKIYNTGNIYT